jgi:hypothetical protein
LEPAVVAPRATAWWLATKAELCAVAMSEVDVSKSSFDFAWIDAIERTGRHDWDLPIKPKGAPN